MVFLRFLVVFGLVMGVCVFNGRGFLVISWYSCFFISWVIFLFFKFLIKYDLGGIDVLILNFNDFCCCLNIFLINNKLVNGL